MTSERSFELPAKGDAYTFSVTIRCTWTDGRRRPKAISRRVEKLEECVWEEITDEARRVLRGYQPDEATDAEARLNAHLAEVADNGLPGTARWDACAEVSPHEDVQAEQQAAWKREFRQAATHQYSEQVIRNYSAMARQWRKLLEDVGIGRPNDSPAPYLGRYLVKLAADPDTAAQVVNDLAKAREDKDSELLKLVSDAVRNVENVDVNLLAFNDAHDSALRRLMDWAGLPGPDHAEPSHNGSRR